MVAAGTDETRPALVSVAWSGAEVATTDGHRLHLVELSPVPGDGGRQFRRVKPVVLIPRPAAEVLVKLLSGDKDGRAEVWLRRKGSETGSVLVKWGLQFLEIKLLDQEYPDWNQVIPRPGHALEVAVDREAMLDRFRRAQRMIDRAGQTVEMIMEPGRDLLLRFREGVGGAGEKAELEFPLTVELRCDARPTNPYPKEPESYPGELAHFSGCTMRIAAASKYVLDALQALEGPEVVFQLRDPLCPIMVEDQAGLKVLVMPTRL